MEQSPDVRDPISASASPLADTTLVPLNQPSEPALVGSEPTWLTDGVDVIRATRSWVQYGIVGFTIICIIIGAVEALFGR